MNSLQKFQVLKVWQEKSKMISGLMKYLKTTEIEGSKFMEDAESFGGNKL